MLCKLEKHLVLNMTTHDGESTERRLRSTTCSRFQHYSYLYKLNIYRSVMFQFILLYFLFIFMCFFMLSLLTYPSDPAGLFA